MGTFFNIGFGVCCGKIFVINFNEVDLGLFGVGGKVLLRKEFKEYLGCMANLFK